MQGFQGFCRRLKEGSGLRRRKAELMKGEWKYLQGGEWTMGVVLAIKVSSITVSCEDLVSVFECFRACRVYVVSSLTFIWPLRGVSNGVYAHINT